MACVVYGGSRGIGKAIASVFLKDGYNVAILARNSQRLQETVEELQGGAINCKEQLKGFMCDITKEQDIQTISDRIHRDVGPVDVLVNAAGITQDKLLLRTKLSSVTDVIDTNLVGPMLTCRAHLKGMLQRQQGCIINIGSIVGQRGNRGQTAYSASKAGLVGLTKSLAKEVKGRGIRVNLIAPGFIETDMTMGIKNRAEYEKMVPMGRFGLSGEVANTALFLAKTPYITGQILAVDGGLNLVM